MSAIPQSTIKESSIKRAIHSACRWIVPHTLLDPLGWSHDDRGRAQRHFIVILSALGVTILAIIFSGLMMVLKPDMAHWLWLLQIGLLIALVLLLGNAIVCVQQCLLHPLSQKTHSLDVQKNQLYRMEERVKLANELHDSLAQTLASLRFQVRGLDETLHQGNERAIWEAMERVESSLDEAHLELRELIAHFRAPIDKRGLIPAIETSVSRFRQETETAIFFQNNWNDIELAAETELNVLRIIQEALTNIRKHSDANTVRILLSQNTNNDRFVLIEDDGNGFDQAPTSDHPGKHLGLSIMHERAQNIAAELSIESEPGEGTRVLLEIDSILTEAEYASTAD